MKKRLSIKSRVAINAVIFMGILTAAIATIGYKLYVDSVRENYTDYADTVLNYLVGPIEKIVENSNSFVGKMKSGADPEELLNNVKNSVERFVKDAEQFDDFTMLCVEYYGK